MNYKIYIFLRKELAFLEIFITFNAGLSEINKPKPNKKHNPQATH